MSENKEQPIDPKLREVMRGIGTAIDSAINGENMDDPDYNPEYGFVLLVFPFGQPDGEHRSNYISNAQRSQIATYLREKADYLMATQRDIAREGGMN